MGYPSFLQEWDSILGIFGIQSGTSGIFLPCLDPGGGAGNYPGIPEGIFRRGPQIQQIPVWEFPSQSFFP